MCVGILLGELSVELATHYQRSKECWDGRIWRQGSSLKQDAADSDHSALSTIISCPLSLLCVFAFQAFYVAHKLHGGICCSQVQLKAGTLAKTSTQVENVIVAISKNSYFSSYDYTAKRNNRKENNSA